MILLKGLSHELPSSGGKRFGPFGESASGAVGDTRARGFSFSLLENGKVNSMGRNKVLRGNTEGISLGLSLPYQKFYTLGKTPRKRYLASYLFNKEVYGDDVTCCNIRIVLMRHFLPRFLPTVSSLFLLPQ